MTMNSYHPSQEKAYAKIRPHRFTMDTTHLSVARCWNNYLLPTSGLNNMHLPKELVQIDPVSKHQSSQNYKLDELQKNYNVYM